MKKSSGFFDKWFWTAFGILTAFEFFVSKTNIILAAVSGLIGALFYRWIYGKWGWKGVIIAFILVRVIIWIFILGILIGALGSAAGGL